MRLRSFWLKKVSKKYIKVKRILDFSISLIVIILLCPLMLSICILIKLTSKGPVLFKQKRFGKDKKFFEIMKFRTMRVDTPNDVPTHLLANPRDYITPIGRFLRKTSLDELPQLFQVLKGDMAIVGPRPALWNQYDLMEERDKGNSNKILPGLTGWAQIHGRDQINIEEKAKLDNFYADNMGLMIDIKIMLCTVVSVMWHDGVLEGGTETQNE